MPLDTLSIIDWQLAIKISEDTRRNIHKIEAIINSENALGST